VAWSEVLIKFIGIDLSTHSEERLRGCPGTNQSQCTPHTLGFGNCIKFKEHTHLPHCPFKLDAACVAVACLLCCRHDDGENANAFGATLLYCFYFSIKKRKKRENSHFAGTPRDQARRWAAPRYSAAAPRANPAILARANTCICQMDMQCVAEGLGPGPSNETYNGVGVVVFGQ
jgi:hypothetical protein